MHESNPTPHVDPPPPARDMRMHGNTPMPVAATHGPKFAPQQPGKPDPIAVRVMASPPFVPVIDNPPPTGTPVESDARDLLAANRHPDDPTKVIPKPMGPDQLAPETPKAKSTTA